MITARFDGGCIGNPGGKGSCACLITNGDEELHRESKYLGEGTHITNNVAEFEGVLMILEWINANYSNQTVTIVGDSQVVINRLGRNKKHPTGVSAGIATFCRKEFMRQLNLGRDIRVKWEPRDQNEECDAMCSLEIDESYA